MTKPDKANLALDQDQRAHKSQYKCSLSTRSFEPEFVINSGACATESVTRAANSQLHETLRAPASVSWIHFSRESAQFIFVLKMSLLKM